MFGRILPIVFLSFVCALAMPVSAQSTLTQGAYEFEDCGSDCTFSGTWGESSNGAQHFAVSTGAETDYVEFSARGKTLTIYRIVTSGLETMEVCINASCETVVNATVSTNSDGPYTRNLTGGNDTVRITGDLVFLDYFIILNEAPAATATILPSSTPAPTATPQPSSTPQPTWTMAPSITPAFTATPQPIGGVDSSSVYATLTSGQMTRFDYVASAGSVHIANLLTALFFSVWAMFILAVFVLRRGA